MGRLVEASRIVEVPQSRLETTGGRATMTLRGDEFADRLAKYIPAEVLGAYLALENGLDLKTAVTKVKTTAVSTAATTEAAGANVQTVLEKFGPQLPMGVFLLGLVFTPLYIWHLGRTTKSPWATHALVATLAFAVWAYAMGGSFFMQSYGSVAALYDGKLASAALIVFTLISGLVKPPSQDGA